jgi:hypothetical protein
MSIMNQRALASTEGGDLNRSLAIEICRGELLMKPKRRLGDASASKSSLG